jgi:hypothetical protein
MRIQQSTVSMSSTHILTEDTYKKETLKKWVGSQRPDFEKHPSKPSQIPWQLDTVEISDEALQLLPKASDENEFEFQISEQDKRKIELLQRFLEKLTGRKIKFYSLEKFKSKDPSSGITVGNTSIPKAPQRQGWGIEYDFHESHVEKEAMSFSLSGIIKTADGREISFSAQLNMSREFASQQDIHIRAGDAAAVDPLVINFGGTAPELSNSTFAFDLDCNGSPDQIHKLSSSSGFLALDSNNDGIINSGKELFGPNTGDGFKELNQYDSDGNGWIDENDPVFDKLRIWVKDEQGNDQLFALGVKGVGAIYVGNISTPFDIKNNDNSLLGQVRKTGVFINENGSAGTIQHIDMVV